MTLVLENVSRRIKNNYLIKDLTLDVKNGECLAILGPSGCGKSTTLRVIAGLDKLNTGRILLNNIDITNYPPEKRAIGMVFQSYALYPHLTVYSNLSIGLEMRGANKKEVNDQVNSVLLLMQLDQLSSRYPSQLSGGQRQRVALARALLRNPEVFLLDEPMSNLDAKLREELRPELREFIKQSKRPVIYVTHDQDEAMALADRIVILNKGLVAQVGSPMQLYKEPKNIFVARFIGRPEINLVSSTNKQYIYIRPENIKLTKNGVKCKFLYREWLGMNQIIVLELNKQIIRVVCNTDIEINDIMQIEWAKSDEHIFDVETGIRCN